MGNLIEFKRKAPKTDKILSWSNMNEVIDADFAENNMSEYADLFKEQFAVAYEPFKNMKIPYPLIKNDGEPETIKLIDDLEESKQELVKFVFNLIVDRYNRELDIFMLLHLPQS